MTDPPRPGIHVPPPSIASGGHPLPERFSAASSATVRRRRRAPHGLLFGLIAGVALIAIVATVQVTANLGYDSAAAQYADATHDVAVTKADAVEQIADLRGTTAAATSILTSEGRAITAGTDLEAALGAAVEEGETTASRAEEIAAADPPHSGAKPVVFWELFEATNRLEQQRDDAERLSQDLTAETARIADAKAAITASGVAVVSSAGEAAAGFEGAHPSARNEAVIALRTAASDAIATTAVDDGAATTYLSLQDAAAQVVATENEEMAEKAGPLRDARLEIEAFARSLAPGVLLEFDWSDVVNGAGYNGSMGGYTTWWWDDPGRANIELSNSVAEQWPAARSKALIAHEVGHAISVKCQGMYDASTQDSIEKWATAWAIGMGFTDDANGVWAYGYPPQNYIDAAAGCR